MSRITGVFGRFAARRRSKAGPKPGATTAVVDRVVVSYEPDIDGNADPGEVVWGWVPYEEDPTQGKDRPIVVIGRWGTDLAGLPLTSKQHGDDPDRFPVGTGGWDPQHRPSYACLDRLQRLAPGSVRREGSALDRRTFDRLVEAYNER